jgi:hypothetical protein
MKQANGACLQRDGLRDAGLNDAQLIPAVVQPLQRVYNLESSVQVMQRIATKIDVAGVGDILYRIRYNLKPEVIPQHHLAFL